PASAPEAQWYQRLNQHLYGPLAAWPAADPIDQKLVYIYAHMFGYDADFAASRNLTTVSAAYAWPPADVAGGWPAAFLHDDDGPNGPKLARPSFKPQATRT